MAIYENTGCLTYKDKSGDIQRLYPVTKLDCIDGVAPIKQHIEDFENPHKVTVEQLGLGVNGDEFQQLSGVTSNIQGQIDKLTEDVQGVLDKTNTDKEEVSTSMQNAHDAMVSDFDGKLETLTASFNGELSKKANKESSKSIVLAVSSWSTDSDGVISQQIAVEGFSASSNVIVGPSAASLDSYAAYINSGVVCIEDPDLQSDGKLTFICSAVPEVDISVNLMIFDFTIAQE